MVSPGTRPPRTASHTEAHAQPADEDIGAQDDFPQRGSAGRSYGQNATVCQKNGPGMHSLSPASIPVGPTRTQASQMALSRLPLARRR